jgi:hypothetical protein
LGFLVTLNKSSSSSCGIIINKQLMINHNGVIYDRAKNDAAHTSLLASSICYENWVLSLALSSKQTKTRLDQTLAKDAIM